MPLTPDDVSNKRFTPVRLREGYDMGEVDQFLDEVEAELSRLIAENDDLREKLRVAQEGPASPSPAPAAPAFAAPEPEPEPVAEVAPEPEPEPVTLGKSQPESEPEPEPVAAAPAPQEIKVATGPEA
ncbi:MAG: DivIVA domain-containing protein, partial [Marmoricola sp.]